MTRTTCSFLCSLSSINPTETSNILFSELLYPSATTILNTITENIVATYLPIGTYYLVLLYIYIH